MTVIVKAIAYFTSEAVYPSLRTIRVSVRSLLRLTCLRVQTVPSDRLVAPTREIYKERNLLFGANIIFSMLNPASYSNTASSDSDNATTIWIISVPENPDCS
ncbi:hypothetical protein An05g02150 [Aspergillus niger]|uniref:Uncharacterized protein n=2 Tax=Aspergillus niger TaxID=5061 RepID=A2QL10_ASPNC|nr:hypothetical protein An05g02150 [Aspergillus niger]CAK44876.1 hypothetical protein An05g02150 [Aspergillus niger]